MLAVLSPFCHALQNTRPSFFACSPFDQEQLCSLCAMTNSMVTCLRWHSALVAQLLTGQHVQPLWKHPWTITPSILGDCCSAHDPHCLAAQPFCLVLPWCLWCSGHHHCCGIGEWTLTLHLQEVQRVSGPTPYSVLRALYRGPM